MKKLLIGLIVIVALAGGLFVFAQRDSATSKQSNEVETQEQIDEIVSDQPKIDPSKLPTADPGDNETPEGSSISETELILPVSEDAFPVESNHFGITVDADDTYNVTLYAIINRPEQYQEYLDQLSQYKKEALEYMNEQNVVIEDVNITYSPKEASDL